MKILNLTPHPLTISDGDRTLTIPPSGTVARATSVEEHVGVIRCVPDPGKPDWNINVTRSVFGEPVDLPAPVEGTVLVVSRITAEAARAVGRVEDIYLPGPAVRDFQGRVIGCEGLSQL